MTGESRRASGGPGAAIMVVLAAVFVACSPPERAPLPAATFAFGIVGDAPYSRFDQRAYRQLLADVAESDIAFLIHLGDLHGGPCSDAVLDDRLRSLQAVPLPVIYTPGDNEWADCHGGGAGGYRPLERLRRIRRTFFADPHRSLGAEPMALAPQADGAGWPEFVENARWHAGSYLFATVHIVGSWNATEAFPGRTAADDSAAARRMRAAIAWLDETFAVARRDSARGVFIAMHADPWFELRSASGPYEPLLQRIASHAAAFDGPVVLMHGDSHSYRVDRPLRRSGTVDTLSNFVRIETYGSPDVGWVRVVVDTAKGRLARVEPRLMPKRLGM